jgi:lipoprotein-anchoring transpeptidase ErfK/SrfK
MKYLVPLLAGAIGLSGCERAPESPSPTPPAPVETVTPAPPPDRPLAGTDSGQVASDLIKQALALKADGKLADARALLQPLAAGDAPSERAMDLLGEINTQIIFTAVPAPEKVDHTIVAGDTLGKLAAKYNTTIDLIKRANNLATDVIRLGDRLRIYQGEFSVVVSKNANTLTVTDHGNFFKRYRVGTGEHSKTPVGEFKIKSRIAQPPWYRADGATIPYGDKENILGTHWLGLDIPRYGIHGTWETNSIGKQATAGCIRLLNDDMAELFTLLPLGTPVKIRD